MTILIILNKYRIKRKTIIVRLLRLNVCSYSVILLEKKKRLLWFDKNSFFILQFDIFMFNDFSFAIDQNKGMLSAITPRKPKNFVENMLGKIFPFAMASRYISSSLNSFMSILKYLYWKVVGLGVHCWITVCSLTVKLYFFLERNDCLSRYYIQFSRKKKLGH